MQIFGDVSINRKKLSACVAGFAAVAVPIVFGLAFGTQNWAQSKPPTTPSREFVHEYDVVSIKPTDPARQLGIGGIVNTVDGLIVRDVSTWGLITAAYGIRKDQISDAPKWFDAERYDIDAKMDSAVADEMQKLEPEKNQALRQQMLQALLADRFRLQVSRESKDLAVYLLVVGKNGPKLQEAMPAYVGPNDFNGADGNRATDSVVITKSGTVVGQAASIATLATALSRQMGRPVLDKTELVGKYDFTFKFAPDRLPSATPSESAANGQALPAPPDPGGTNLADALQSSLGLKLESGKGPVEIFVINHVERPSGN